MERTAGGGGIALLQKLGICFAACVVGLFLAELMMRLVGLSFPVFDTYDQIRGVKLMPGKEGWYRKEGEAYLRINELGYRDVEHNVFKPENTFRIAVLGDSFTEARQMPVEDTYWHQLGALLEDCPAINEQNIEVLNFGIGGYGTTQQLLTYDLHAKQFEPDLVVLGFFAGNDIHENSRALSAKKADWRISSPFFEIVDNELKLLPATSPPAWKRWLYIGIQHSRLLELVNEARRQWSVRHKRKVQEERVDQVEAGIHEGIYQEPDNDEMVEAWTLTSRILTELNDKVRGDGADFIVATIPTSVQTHPNLAYRDELKQKLGVDDLLFPERQLASFGEEGGFQVFPLVAELQKAAGDRHFHGFANTGMGHGHMNMTGHRVMAELLTPRVCSALKP